MIVLGVLMAGFAWALVIPPSMAEPPSVPASVLFVVLLCAFGTALLLALWVAVSPAPPAGSGPWSVVLLLAVSLALWPPLYAWAERGEVPWAWAAGFAIAASALVSWRAGAVAAVALGLAAGIGGAIHGSVTENLLTAFGCAAAVWLMCQVLVWLLRLLRAAQEGREVRAELAIAEERLRVSRELHDVLGHRLGVIALKAELAAELAVPHPERTAEECDGIRRLAAETLAEARRAVHGDTVADLAAQLDAAGLVLDSAGIETAIDADENAVAALPEALSRLMAAVVREAVTNVLRHSEARHVSITLSGRASPVRLVIVNDGVPDRRSGAASGGTGLASLSARCSAAGARLAAGRDGEGRFELRIDAAADRIAP
ncbi:histidine kinase [Nocardiopsis sp. RSe5-2]|uniref:Histidine kinase n=1 Tax=Nocardiopsis endophytica TaxID=3018445 RepID=A0ABT4UCS3_9ACTN|nr:histidine kinase [Nocardiopsis endophytica]MDA2814753.1 histidine kinase [Nocardiopsis endophytica]